MKQERVNVKVVPDVRRSKNDERFPLKLRITYKGVRKYYATGYDSTEEEWKNCLSEMAQPAIYFDYRRNFQPIGSHKRF